MESPAGVRTVPPVLAGVRDPYAWEKFCELVARGAGVCDHPGRPVTVGPSSEKFFRLETERVDQHVRNLAPLLIDHSGLAGGKVLEFGGGTGGLAVAMIRAGIRSVDSVEPVQQNLEAGRWRAKAYGEENSIRFHHVPDTRKLPFPTESFDGVVCSSVLQYVPDAEMRRTLLTEMARALRPGGMLIVCATGNGLYPGGPHSSRWWSNLFPARAARLGHNRGITYREIARTLVPLGFRVVPQGFKAITNWENRIAERRPSSFRFHAVKAAGLIMRLGGGALKPLTGMPPEGLLPFADFAFRKHATGAVRPGSNREAPRDAGI